MIDSVDKKAFMITDAERATPQKIVLSVSVSLSKPFVVGFAFRNQLVWLRIFALMSKQPSGHNSSHSLDRQETIATGIEPIPDK